MIIRIFIFIKYYLIRNMAFLKEDFSYTHIIAIDFGTGASGYGIAPKMVEPG